MTELGAAPIGFLFPGGRQYLSTRQYAGLVHPRRRPLLQKQCSSVCNALHHLGTCPLTGNALDESWRPVATRTAAILSPPPFVSCNGRCHSVQQCQPLAPWKSFPPAGVTHLAPSPLMLAMTLIRPILSSLRIADRWQGNFLSTHDRVVLRDGEQNYH